MKEKIYLAIPYSWNAQKSFDVANKVAGILMSQGHIVFSPVSHSHMIADHLDEVLRYDHDFWMAQDLPLVYWADKVVVVVIGDNGHELIEQSKGVQSELMFAKQLNKIVEMYEYYD